MQAGRLPSSGGGRIAGLGSDDYTVDRPPARAAPSDCAAAEKANLVVVESRDRKGTVVDVDIESRSCTVRLDDGAEVDTLWSGLNTLGRK
eukprot:5184681-Karenia_brevis.AAC.1